MSVPYIEDANVTSKTFVQLLCLYCWWKIVVKYVMVEPTVMSSLY